MIRRDFHYSDKAPKNYIIDKDFGVSPPIVTVAECKTHAGITYDTDDEYIQTLINAVQPRLERASGLSFYTRPMTLQAANFKGGFPIPYGPIQSIVSVKDLEGNDITDYKLGGLKFKTIQWPRQELQIEYIAGYVGDGGDFIGSNSGGSYTQHFVKADWIDNGTPAPDGSYELTVTHNLNSNYIIFNAFNTDGSRPSQAIIGFLYDMVTLPDVNTILFKVPNDDPLYAFDGYLIIWAPQTVAGGYSTTSVPAELKLAVMSEVAYRYNNRGDQVDAKTICSQAKAYLVGKDWRFL